MTHKIIQQLLSIRGLEIECPVCDEAFPIARGKLFNMYDKYPPVIQILLRERFEAATQLQDEVKQRKKELTENRKRKPARIATSALSCNFGQIAEQILPAFRTFPYSRCECRILFKPIDYVIFTNLSRNGRVETIKFVDVKTGGARLDLRQRQIRNRIREGKIKHKVLK